MAWRFPFEPFRPELEPDAPGGTDPVPGIALRAAVTGADAYRATRGALRRDGPTLRVGNRFVPLARYREIAFLALGRAAVSQAMAVQSTLGEAVTQGFVAGPDPLPAQVPFRALRAPTGLPGAAEALAAAAAARELAEGLGERDLLLVLLSPGALGYLAAPPAGWDGPAWSQWLNGLTAAGLTGAEVDGLARLLSDGPVAGGLGRLGGAEVDTLLVDRGDGPIRLGGGPTIAATPAERAAARSLLARVGQLAGLPVPLRERLGPGEAPAGLDARVHRPVVVAAPADALREAGDALGEKRWVPRLAEPPVTGGPEAAADAFFARAEERLAAATADGSLAGRRGMVVLAPTTFDLPEGVDERPAVTAFLARAAATLHRREMSVAAVRTSGAEPRDTAPGAVVGRSLVRPTLPPTVPRPLRMRTGITDVGCLLIGVLPTPGDAGA